MKKPNLNYLNLLIYILFFLFSFLFCKNMANPSDGPRWILLNLTAVILPLSLLIFLRKKKKSIIFEFSFFHLLILILFIWLLFTTVIAIDKANSIDEFINLLSFIILLVFFSFYGKKVNLRNIIRIFVIIISSVSLLGLFQYYGFLGNLFAQVSSPASTFVNKNLATPLVVLFFPFIFFSILFSNSKKKRLIQTFCFAITLSYLIASTTKSSWMGVFLSFVFFVGIILFFKDIRKNSFRKFHRSSLFFLIPGILLTFLIIHIRTYLPAPQDEDLSLNSTLDFFQGKEKLTAHETKAFNRPVAIRLSKWQNSFEIVKDHPLSGIGLGSFDAVYPFYHKSKIDDQWFMPRFFLGGTHNDSLQFIIETGIVGFILILMIFLLIYFFLIKLLHLNDKNMIFYLASLTGITGLIIDSFFNYPFHHPTYLFYTAFLLGTIYAKYQEHFPDNRFKIRFKANRSYSIPVLIILLLISVYISRARYLSGVYLKKALFMENSNLFSTASEYSKKAVDQWQFQNRTLFVNSRILYSYYSNNRSEKSYRELKKYNYLTLQSLPYHYIPNLIRILLITEKREPAQVRNLLKSIPLFLRITPNEQLYDAYELIGYIYYLNRDKANSLYYYRKVLAKFPENEKIRKRVELLLSIEENSERVE